MGDSVGFNMNPLSSSACAKFWFSREKPEQNMPLANTPAPKDKAIAFRRRAFQPVLLNLGLTVIMV